MLYWWYCGKPDINTINTYSLKFLLWIFGRLKVSCFEDIELSVESLIPVFSRNPSATCAAGTAIM